MSPPRQREDSATIAVLTTDVAGLKGRVDKLEERMDEREDSQGGYRKLLDEHRIEDLKAFGKVESLINDVKAGVSKSIGDLEIRVASMSAWAKLVSALIGVLILLTLGFAKWMHSELKDISEAVQARPAPAQTSP